MKTVNSTEAKNRLGEWLEAAQREPIAITRNGRPFAMLVSAGEYERLAALDDAIWAMRAAESEATGYLGRERAMRELLRLIREKRATTTD